MLAFSKKSVFPPHLKNIYRYIYFKMFPLRGFLKDLPLVKSPQLVSAGDLSEEKNIHSITGLA